MKVLGCFGPYGGFFETALERDIDVVARSADDVVPAPVIVTIPRDTDALRAAAPTAEWIHILSTGVDGFPLEVAMGRHDLVVTCARGSAAVPIAEYVLACMLSVAKDLPGLWIHEPAQGWGPPPEEARTLEGATLGLIGLGAIATEIARRAAPFGMDIVAVRRRSGMPAPDGVRVVSSLDEVLAVADHVVMTAPLTPASRHMLDATAFARMKHGVHLVNISRGGLVDTDALLAALDDGTVGFASLDVVEPEPLPAGHRLYGHPRARISPHVSWRAPDALDRIVSTFVENLQRYRAGEPLAGVVDVEAGY